MKTCIHLQILVNHCNQCCKTDPWTTWSFLHPNQSPTEASLWLLLALLPPQHLNADRHPSRKWTTRRSEPRRCDPREHPSGKAAINVLLQPPLPGNAENSSTQQHLKQPLRCSTNTVQHLLAVNKQQYFVHSTKACRNMSTLTFPKEKWVSTIDSLVTIKTMNVTFKLPSAPQHERTILHFSSYIHKKQLTEPAGNILDLLIQHSCLPLGPSPITAIGRVTTSIFVVWTDKSPHYFAWHQRPLFVQPKVRAIAGTL